MTYIRYYGNRTSSLISQLEHFDFTSIRAALIAHVPTKFDDKETDPTAHLWGWPALKRALGSIPGYDTTAANSTDQKTPHIVCQVSSIASLSDKWFRETLFPALSTTSTTPATPSSKKARPTPPSHPKPKFSIIFPTPSEIRTSLDGYAAGGSIHCKLQTAAQRKQFNFMKAHLCHWDPPSPASPAPPATTIATTLKNSSPSNPRIVGKALRGPGAPHIKSFICFNDTKTHDSIDWALLTSANLSTQAWGTDVNVKSGEVRISSYELGVLVWPDLFLEDGAEDEKEESGIGDEGKENGEERGKSKKGGSNRRKGTPTAMMVPTFASDKPTITHIENAITRTKISHQQSKTATKDPEDIDTESETESGRETEPETETAASNVTIVALRMPYDLPLTPYGPGDEVWSARASYAELDRFGRAWNVDG
jgi:tyrosyl-DNA phosphodiesterase 1